MTRKFNKGVSMVEVLLALTIFLILMIPLVSALISGMNTTSSAKETQYRNEYARNLMESVKEVPINVLDSEDTMYADAIAYFQNLGASDVSVNKVTDITTYSVANGDGTTTPCPFDTYSISGKTKLGIADTEYSYAIEISSRDYAKAQAEPKAEGSDAFLNPNNLTSGVVEDLDETKVALISAPLANYDIPAFDSLLTMKLAKVREWHEINNTVFDATETVKKFANDKGRRIINISVSGKKSEGYDVICTLKYSDDCKEPSAETGKSISKAVGMLEYEAYARHFDELPNIYLMYNACIYNGSYADDFITYDLSGMNEDDGNNPDVKVFVVATAEKYSNDITETNDNYSQDWLKRESDDLLYRKAGNNVRENLTIRMAGSPDNLSNLFVYHNIGSSVKTLKVEYDENAASAINNLINGSGSSDYPYTLLPEVGDLNDALEDRGLYKVKIWMQKGDIDAATLKGDSPVLEGTRGGDEID